uniref:Uncharacterized protein n=1 Tax=Arundo donax TaxID=35708 RepID=A0A0A9U6B4_ARUDO
MAYFHGSFQSNFAHRSVRHKLTSIPLVPLLSTYLLHRHIIPTKKLDQDPFEYWHDLFQNSLKQSCKASIDS